MKDTQKRSGEKFLTGKQRCDKKKKVFEYLFLMFWAAFAGYRTFFNTMLQGNLGVRESNRLMNIWLVLIILYIFLKAVIVKCYSRRDILAAGLLLAFFVISYYHSWTKWMELVPFLIVAGKDVPFDKIVKIFLIIVGGELAAAYITSMIGYSDYTIYIKVTQDGNRTYRHAFGTTYPTTFSEFYFFLSAAALYLRRKKAAIIDVILLLFGAFFLNRYCDAKTDTICLVLLAVLAFFLFLKRYLRKRWKQLIRMGSAVLIPIYCVSAVMMAWLTVHYDPSNALMWKLNQIITMRLEVGRRGYDRYGIHLWGRKVKYFVNVLKFGGDKYFNLDCSYVLILINFGVLVFTILMALLTLASYRSWRMGDLALFGILSIIAVECVMENRLLQPQYNVFLLIFFSKLETDSGRIYEVIGGESI